MNPKYYAIGEKFLENGVELMVVKDIDGLENNCLRCHFNDRPEACQNYICTFEEREDGEDVHFLETSKIS